MNNQKHFKLIPFLLLVALLVLPIVCFADPGNQYCITPPFITAGIKPNMLLMIDNSASMYDMAYVDKGKKHCSVSTSKSCFADTDCSYCSGTTTQTCSPTAMCPTGQTCNTTETCSVFDRSPYYCFDQTYSSANSYYSYFDKDKYYYYRPQPTDDFAEVTSAFPSGCPTSVTNTTKTIPNTMCLEYVPGTGTVVNFVAKGNYLNWLTASKMDVEKKILTGGKYDGTGMTFESRGCVGQGYLKHALSTDFVNFNTGATDTNKANALGVTFTITGPQNPYNITAPSTGGQTFINIFAGKVYDYGLCQKAMDDLATGNLGSIKGSVSACLDDSGTAAGYCRLEPARSCTTNSPDCDTPVLSAHCSKDAARSCTGVSDVTSCVVAFARACNVGGAACTTDANCQKAATYACSNNPAKACTNIAGECTVVEKIGSCQGQASKSCRPATEAADCQVGNNYKGPCINYTAPSIGTCNLQSAAVDNRPCNPAASTDFGPCLPASGGYVGDCVLSTQAAAVKGKVVFNQAMQSCWKVRGCTNCTAANDYGFNNGDLSSTFAKCPDVYSGFATCSNNHFHMCSTAADCGGNTCDKGPAAIVAGHPALFCATDYMGQFYEQSGLNWVRKSSATDTQIYAAYWDFCQSAQAPPVTDPTDAPSNSASTDTVPAILSSVGVEAQLGGAIATMRAKVAVPTLACTINSDCASLKDTSCVGGLCKPSGLVQEFGNMIRLGAMKFNPFGSSSETALIGTPKTCSDGSVCTKDIDCGGAVGSCATATNLDGGRIIYPIGNGFCATMTGSPCTVNAECSGADTCLNSYCGSLGTTVCTTVENCSGANQACIGNSVGTHTTSGDLVNVLDQIRANAWTPFSEAFYNAIGYFARVPSGADAGKSRTDLRLNNLNTTSTDYSLATSPPVDFNESYNPSEYRCQQNYILLITDGSSTADRNPDIAKITGVSGATSDGFAKLYASQAGITQTNCTGAPSGVTTDYGGTNNLPIMSWIARNRQISALSKVSPASTALPVNARDSITSFVVFNGESNGASGDCNSVTMLSKTAVNGGTTLKQASDYPGLINALRSVFQDVAAKAASGTAASILSNSEGSGANILQAVFYPKKIFADNTAANWIGEMQNLWYFVDPYINNSTIREDTNQDLKLNLVSDYVTRFDFNNSSDRTMVQLYQDTNGDGTGDTAVGGLIDPDYVKSIWRAGKLLWSRNISTSPRTIYTSLNGTSLYDFSSATFPGGAVADHSTTLAPYLNVAAAAAPTLINWVHGLDLDPPVYRNRTVKITDPVTSVTSSGAWRLGDIISSTPRVQSTVRLNTYNLPPPGGYNDKTYESYINSSGYQNRGMVYVGANDGMLHAFNLGILSVKATGNEKASLRGTDLGKEEWAYIPRNYLPYLQYLADPGYQHLYAVDGRTMIMDASIGDASSGVNYWDEAKSANTWRTVVIGGMGLGGASRRSCASDVACVETPINDPDDTSKSLGYSSYFALDVTDQNNPQLLWEFSDNQLGYSTTGPSIVRVGDRSKNGRWFAVFGSGPFGPIDTSTHQFKGGSDHHLRFFVVDLKTGERVKTITTDIDNAFAGSMIGGSIDADRRAGSGVTGNYQDDAVYAGYVKYVTAAGWTDGGVGRIMIAPVIAGAQPDASYIAGTFNWSKVIDGIGPVTTSIARLQDTRVLSKNLWLYFGTGRYFYRDGTSLDDYISPRALYGIKEPCYNTSGKPGNVLDETCSTTLNASCPTTYASGSLVNQTSSVSTVASGDPGWCIDLNVSTATLGAERVVTDPVALTNGTVLFTTFKPTMDKCGYGGNSFLRMVNYINGGVPSCNALQGKVLVQLSTGEFKEVPLAEVFGCPATNTTIITYPPNPGDPPGTPPGVVPPITPPPSIAIGGGKPPSDAPPVISSSTNRPVKKILHIQEH